jgi:CHAT domain-containing protein
MQQVAAAMDELIPLSRSPKQPTARRVILIPTGRLALVPLHAARYQRNGQEHAFLDEFAVTYVPSGRALASCREALASLSGDRPTLLAIGNPLPLPSEAQPLKFACFEADEVSQFFDGPTTLFCDTQATYPTVTDRLGKDSYLHFACHGQFRPDNPLMSGLILSNGKRLTLMDLYTTSLTRTRLAVLSACQTAITDFDKLPEEAVGLPASCLRAGIPGVVGSLWTVDDASTALLMIKFYEYHLKGDAAAHKRPMPPIQALSRAQHWMRNVTRDELSDLFDLYRKTARDRPHMPYDLAQELFTKYTLHRDEYPLAHPYYWAGFAFYGT